MHTGLIMSLILTGLIISFEIGLSPSKKMFYLLQCKPFKSDEKCFLFHLKGYCRSQDI